jgi:hypothetical protein
MGTWRTVMGDSHGDLSGEIHGNVLLFSWRATSFDARGAQGATSGQGYFVYVVPGRGRQHEILGEWRPNVVGDADRWRAFKRPDIALDLGSTRPERQALPERGDEGEGHAGSVGSFEEEAEEQFR